MAAERPAVLGENAWVTPGRFAALLAFLVAICFPTVLFGSHTFFFRDFAFFSYPLAQYQREAFWAGEIPLWNPYNNCGLPFLAQWNTMVLYPGSLIYLLLPLPWSLSLFSLVHYWFAGLGMYFLVRRWSGSPVAGAVAGTAFVFSGLVLSCLKWPNNIAALGWMPWLVLLVRRGVLEGGRIWCVAAVVGALQMLTGAPEIILFTWAICGVVWLADVVSGPARLRITLRFILLVGGVTALSAAQLWPFLDLLAQSQRDRHFGGPQWAMPIWGGANFFVPLFKTFASYHGVHAQPDQYWISTYYVPLIMVVLAVAGLLQGLRKPALWLLALGVLCAWLALGDRGGLYLWFRDTFPFLSFMRFPVKFVVPACFVICLLGGMGLGKFQEQPGTKFLQTIAAIFPVVILAILLVAREPVAIRNGVFRLIFVLCSLALLTYAIRAEEPKRRSVAWLLLLLAVFGDGATHAPWQNPVAPAWVYKGEGAEMHPRPKIGESRAMISPAAYDKLDHLQYDTPADDVMASRLSLYANANLIDHVPKVDGFYALYLREMSHVLFSLYSRSNPPPALLDFMAVSQYTAPGKTLQWTNRSSVLPWVTAGQEVKLRPAEDILSLVTADTFQPASEVYVVSLADTETIAAAPGAKVVHASGGNQQWNLQVESPQPTVVVVAQAWHPNWRATVNGQLSPIWKANSAFQAIRVPAGRTVVELRYVDDLFKRGVWISLATLLLLGVCGLWPSRRKT